MNQSNNLAQSLIEAAQIHDSPSAIQQARTWSEVQRRWAAGDLGPSIEVGAESTVAATSTAGTVKLWLVISGVLTLAGAGAIVSGVTSAPTNDDRAEVVAVAPTAPEAVPASSLGSSSVPVSPAEAGAAWALPASMPPTQGVSVSESPPDPATPSHGSSLDTSPSPKPGERSASSARGGPSSKSSKERSPEAAVEEPENKLGGEVALLASARRALGQGSPARALRLLERHRRKFPEGTLRQERELSRVTALCSLGQKTRAKAAANAFLAREPSSSALRGRIAHTCAGVD